MAASVEGRASRRDGHVADVREGGTWTRRQRLKNDLVYLVVRVMLAVALRLPRRVLRAACGALGFVAWIVLADARRVVARRLEAGLCERAGGRTRRAFSTAAAMLADTIELLDPAERAARRLTLDASSRRVFEEALAEGRGVVFVAAHLGPWERMAALLAEEGFPVTTVARESYDPRLTELYERVRRPRGVRSLYRGRPGVALSIARELAAGRAVGFLIDLPARVPSVSQRLFGAEQSIPVGPARIALARRAAVLLGTCAPSRNECNDLHSTDLRCSKVVISRISTEGSVEGPGAEAELVGRLVEELERRVAAWPEGWLGLFVPPVRGLRLRPARDRH